MKSIYKLSFLLSLICMLSGCDSFLKEDPRSSATPDLIFQSESGVVAALRNCYTIFTASKFDVDGGVTAAGITPAANRAFFLLSEVPGDDCWIRNTNNNPRVTLDTYQFDADNENIATMYFSLFLGIKNVNHFIANVQKSGVGSEKFRNEAIAEAKAIRAYLYFVYVRLFGEGPLLNESLDSTDLNNLERTDIASIYEQIISDLEAALILENKHIEGAGRMSKAAVKSILAEVYLTMAGHVYNKISSKISLSKKDMYTRSAEYALDVWQNMGFSLYPSYEELFTVKGNNSSESILEAVSEQNRYPQEAVPDVQNSYDLGVDKDGNQTFKGMFWHKDPETGKDVYLTKTLGRYTLSPVLLGEFQQNTEDKRMNTLVKAYNNSFGNRNLEVHGTSKYADVTVFERNLSDSFESRAHYKILRLASVMLIYAEASNEAEGKPNANAIAAINEIRERAGIFNSEIPDTYEAFKNAVYMERRKELYFEGYRWFDLVRTEQLEQKVKESKSGVNYTVTPLVSFKHYLFPIPNVAFRLNPELGKQNEGW